MIQPRQYQIDAMQSIFRYFADGRKGNPVLALPTGSGKGVIIAMFLQTVFHNWPTQRVIMLTHVKELILQNYLKLRELWPQAPVGIFSAGLNRRDACHAITFAGIASVAKKPELFGHIDLVVIDEAHLVSPSDETMYQMFLSALHEVNPKLKVIGLTATPWRLGQGHITDDGIFTDVCFDLTTMEAFNRLIAEGFLCPVIPRETRYTLDVNDVHLRGGEFIPHELQRAVDKEVITRAALEETLRLAADRSHWLIFASGVEHAIHISDMLNDMGVSCIAIHSKMEPAARDEAIRGFKSGKYRACANNNIMTTGIDFPGLDCIVMLRPTSSTVLWIQMIGRGTRPAQGKKNCLVLDFSGNTKRLGPINDPVIPRKKGESSGGEAPVKTCPVCNTYNHTTARYCISCGHEFVFQTKIQINASPEQLIKGELPITEVFEIDTITYSKHRKHDRPDMMKVTYFCGLKKFTEYVCIEHEGFAGRKARQWWYSRTTIEFPLDTDDAILFSDKLAAATHLRVWINKPYPEILEYCYDGTCFGNKEAGQSPTVSIQQDAGNKVDIDVDDIPF